MERRRLRAVWAAHPAGPVAVEHLVGLEQPAVPGREVLFDPRGDERRGLGRGHRWGELRAVDRLHLPEVFGEQHDRDLTGRVLRHPGQQPGEELVRQREAELLEHVPELGRGEHTGPVDVGHEHRGLYLGPGLLHLCLDPAFELFDRPVRRGGAGLVTGRAVGEGEGVVGARAHHVLGELLEVDRASPVRVVLLHQHGEGRVVEHDPRQLLHPLGHLAIAQAAGPVAVKVVEGPEQCVPAIRHPRLDVLTDLPHRAKSGRTHSARVRPTQRVCGSGMLIIAHGPSA